MGRRALFLTLLPAIALLPAGCSKPLVEGPQITRVPQTFMFDLNPSGAALVLEGRAKGDQRGYFAMGPDDTHASIMITEYRGGTSREQVEQARAAAQAAHRNQEHGPLEVLRIDKQPAWGWLVTQMWKGEIASITYVAVIPYEKPGVTYAVEFYSSHPRFRDKELMKETLQTFRVKQAGVNYGTVGLALALGIGFLAAFNHTRTR
jgi:hypothetical protein